MFIVLVPTVGESEAYEYARSNVPQMENVQTLIMIAICNLWRTINPR